MTTKKKKSSVAFWLVTLLYLAMLLNPAIKDFGRIFAYLFPCAIIISLFNIRLFYGQILALTVSLLAFSYYILRSLPHGSPYWADFAALPLLIFSSVSLMRCYVHLGGEPAAFLRVMIYACLSWSAILLFERASARFKDLLSNFFERNLDAGEHLVKLRSAGIHENGGDGLSLNLCLMLTVLVLYLLVNRPTGKVKLTLFILFVLISGSFAGRSGPFVFLGVIFLCLPFINILYFFIFFVFIVVALSAITITFSASDVYALAAVYGWEDPSVRFLKTFFHFGESGIFSTIFGKMLIFRDNAFDLFMGTGSMERELFQAGMFLGQSDLGLVRIIGAIGLTGYFSILIIYMIPFLDMVRKRETRGTSLVMLSVPLYVFIADFKIIYSLTLFPLFLLYGLYGLERLSRVKNF